MATLAPSAAPSSAPTRTTATLTDLELVEQVRRGCDRAFEELYARYHRRIAAYVNGMVKDHARAEDIAQDVFISALRRIRETDRPIAVKPWLYEIAKNACIDQHRRARRTEEVSFDADGGLSPNDAGRLAAAPAQPTPQQLAEQKASLESLQGAFGGLSETHHEILVMRELEGLSYREIGEKLSMSRPSVESTLFRARRRLSEEYEELVSGERCRRVQSIIVACATHPSGRLGTRDQRRLAAHVSHCQPCRRHAVVAGLDASALTAKASLRAKVAAFLPLPALLRRRLEEVAPAPAPGSGHLAPLANLSAQVGAIDPALTSSWAKAAVAAATIAVAGVGAGAAVDHSGLGGDGPPRHTLRAKPAAAEPASRPAVTRTHTRAAAATAGPTASPAAGKRAAAVGVHVRPATAPAAAVTPSTGAPAPSGASTPPTAGAPSTSGPAGPAADPGASVPGLISPSGATAPHQGASSPADPIAKVAGTLGGSAGSGAQSGAGAGDAAAAVDEAGADVQDATQQALAGLAGLGG